VAISEDGASVYVAANVEGAVSVFDRDPWSGDLSFVEAYFNDTGGITGMNGPASLAVSPDGANVYVAGNGSCIVVFDRDLYDGTLSYNQSICGRPRVHRYLSLAVAPDGNHVYSVGNRNDDQKYFDAVAVFGRDPLTGQLSLVEVQVEGMD
jgi:DNA-binding beta-propeller fold protein YncE